MKNFKRIIFYGVFLFSFSLFSQTPPNDKNWLPTLVPPSTDFNVTHTLDSKWQKETFDKPLISFLESNVDIINDGLEIVTKWDNTIAKVTTGRIVTTDHYGYGFYEAKIAFAPGMDMWQAFWLIGGESVKNTYGEIDISEKFMNLQNNQSSTNLHLQNGDQVGGEVFSSPTSLIFPNYHIYSVEWSPLNLIFYFDGKPIRSFFNDSRVCSNNQIVVLGIDPGTSIYAKFDENRILRSEYVHVYKLNMSYSDENATIDPNNWNFTNFPYGVRKAITVKNISVPQYTSVTLRSMDLLIDGDFTCPVNSEFTYIQTAKY